VIRNDSLSYEAQPAFNSPGSSESDGELVVVQPKVLATVDHAFGNLFQRVYHLVRTARNGTAETFVVLEESVRELQGLLELFVDYVAPMPVQIRSLQATNLLLSFQRHLADAVGADRVQIDCGDLLDVLVVVDPARMSRIFDLLSRTWHRVADATEIVRGRAALSSDGSHLEITFDHVPGGGAHDEMRWALAQKLIDIQGGELRQLIAADGVRWTLRLPVSNL
jgi:hypothetical protein